jgi:hypothetical protein
MYNKALNIIMQGTKYEVAEIINQVLYRNLNPLKNPLRFGL